MEGQYKQVEGVINNILLPNGYGEIDSIFIVGSDAHGTKLPPTEGGTDDTDYIVIFMPSVKNLLGFHPYDHYVYNIDGLDIVLYSFPKLMKMLRNANPNVLALLFQDNEFIPVLGDAMIHLRDSRDLFLSKKLYERFIGYASSQIKTMEKAEFKGYMGVRRKAMVIDHGYDTKAAAHALRVMWMGIELFRTDRMNVNRDGIDAGTLKNIKRGLYGLETIMQWIEEAKTDLHNAFENTSLPDEPNYDAIEELLVKKLRSTIMHEFFYNMNYAFGKAVGFGVASGMAPGIELTDSLRIPRNLEGEFHRYWPGLKNSTNMAGVANENSTKLAGGENSTDVDGGQESDEIGVGKIPEGLIRVAKMTREGGGSVFDYLEIKDDKGGYLETM